MCYVPHTSDPPRERVTNSARFPRMRRKPATKKNLSLIKLSYVRGLRALPLPSNVKKVFFRVDLGLNGVHSEAWVDIAH